MDLDQLFTLFLFIALFKFFITSQSNLRYIYRLIFALVEADNEVTDILCFKMVF